MESGSKHSIYGFDKFRLDCDKLMLYRDGEPVTLPPKVVKTLAVLVENRGSILSKNELMESVWEDSIVEEANLSQNLYLLRKTLGSKPDGSPYIETLRRRGYRFTSDNVELETAPAKRVEEPAVVAAHASAAPRYAVERRGNVVALVDWKAAEDGPTRDEERKATEVAEPEQLAEQQHRSGFRGWTAVAAVIVVAAVGIGFWLNSPRAAEVISQEAPAQLEFMPLTNGEDVNDATISRDGKYFTYHENDGDFSRILVQQTGQSKPIEILPRSRKLVGAKTFSPDSQYIYFVARDISATHTSLYRIPTLGGVRSKVVEYANSYPSFSPDGTMIAFQRSDSNLRTSLVISSTDGTHEKVLLSYSPDRSIVPNPAWSPDGNMIAFGSMERNGAGQCVLSALDLKTSEVRRLSEENWDTCFRLEWRRDGRGIVFVGTKYGEGNTIRRDQVYYLSMPDGVARRLTTDVHRNQYDSLGITDSNQVLHVPFSRTSQIWVMDPGGNSRTATALTKGSSDGRAGLIALPEGRIAFTARTGENLGAWIIDADGSNRQQFISEPLIIEELRATPDGKYFFYASQKDKRSHLYRVDADGSNPKQITSGDSHETDSAVSPDGKWIVYDLASLSDIQVRRLWKNSIEGGAATKISEVNCAVPNFSPTGKYISCIWGDKIYVIAPEDGELLHTFTTVRTSYLNIGARFTPDENSLVYIAGQKGVTNLWLQPLDGKPPKKLTDFLNGDVYNFTYSADGSKLYLARGFQTRDVVLISGLQ